MYKVKFHENLDLFETNDSYVLGPSNSSNENVLHLKFLKRNGDVTQTNEYPGLGKRLDIKIYGLFGVLKLKKISYLILITGREFIGYINSHKVWKVTSYELMNIENVELSPEEAENNEAYLDMIRSSFKMCNIMFSYTHDVTSSLSKQVTESQLAINDMFAWNYRMMEDVRNLWETSSDSRDAIKSYIMGFACGYFSSLKSYVRGKIISLALISRISFLRVGIRYHSRGANKDGFTSNFVETEQITSLDGEVESFIQIRGSIPLVWGQPIGGEYNPKIVLGNDEENYKSLSTHFDCLLDRYKSVYVINLLDSKGRELDLSSKYKEMTNKYGSKDIEFINFDFHEKCSHMKWENLSFLLDEIRPKLKAQKTFRLNKSGEILSTQDSIFRTNCLDCLDRTNVVQNEIAKEVFVNQLKRAGILEEKDKLDVLSDLEHNYRKMWVSNANIISQHYSGTSALKTDFTLTKKRTTAGVISDLIKSAIRHYRNNYMDGYVHDSLIFFTGGFNARRAPDCIVPPRKSVLRDCAPLIQLFLCILGSTMIYYNLRSSGNPFIRMIRFILPIVTFFKFSLSKELKRVNKPSLPVDLSV